MEPNFLSLLTFCFGLLLGHRLNLWRDRRKDFNEVAQPLRETLLKEKDRPSPDARGIGKIDADRLESAMPFWKRCAFRKAWNVYSESKSEIYQDAVGQTFYKNPEHIVLQIDNVLRFTTRQ